MTGIPSPPHNFNSLQLVTESVEARELVRIAWRDVIAGVGMIPLDYAEIDARGFVALEGQGGGRLQLIKLYDDGLVAARVDNSISSLDDYASTQQWAKALHDHPMSADGVVYMSRFLGHANP